MATSLCGLGAWPGSLRPWVLTCLVTLMLLPPPSNSGDKENRNQPVCGKPWWPDSLKEIRHWPWEVSVRIENEHVCGGALLDFSWVISAAHCIQGNKEYSVMLGSSKLQPKGSSWARKIRVGDIILHPKYWGRNFFRFDIALLHLDIPITYNKYVQPICLPEYNFNLKVGTQCWVTGWGQTKKHSSDNLTLTPELWEAEVFIMDNKKCDRVFHKKSFYPRVIPLIRKNMICATNYGVDSCYVSFWGLCATLFLREDPGGPLACEIDGRWILAGVLSRKKACIEAQNPGVYTRLSKFTRWIQEQRNHGALPAPCRASYPLLLFWLLQLPVGL
ncbi:inactive serine protease 45-like isoform X1 [Peromyscus eremicus]|uniref:inactive serine protease 45-like isoform X1 n=1 Tax=Peromyscus eremicus TaxID=42410 RepID=UPI0027DC7F74|nr:inactive serine protease 45-like isoform X1 [Peromyscus eremicus]